jgi:hypothetical protein
VVPQQIPENYFLLNPFERSGRFYLKAGIRTFRRFLILSGIEKMNWLVNFNGRRTNLQLLLQGTRQAESDHLISFMAICILMLYTTVQGWFVVTGWLVVVNLFANLYPVMLQRYNRGRILRLMAELERAG